MYMYVCIFQVPRACLYDGWEFDTCIYMSDCTLLMGQGESVSQLFNKSICNSPLLRILAENYMCFCQKITYF